MKEVLELEALGYEFGLSDGRLDYVFLGKEMNLTEAQPLFEGIIENRDEAIRYLSNRGEPFDLASRLFAQAQKAEEAEDWERWARLLEAAGLERSKSYATNEYDRRRCPNCPNLGKGPLYVEADGLILCDTPCPQSGGDSIDSQNSGRAPTPETTLSDTLPIRRLLDLEKIVNDSLDGPWRLDPTRPCYACGSMNWHSYSNGDGVYCGTCHPLPVEMCLSKEVFHAASS